MNKGFIETEELVGTTISKIEVDGCHILIKTKDGMTFSYEASDGGYSSWYIIDKKKERGKTEKKSQMENRL